MAAIIDFRGVMLFQCTKARAGTLEKILLPNGDADSDWPDNGKHPDKKSDARRHFAGLLVARSGGIRIEYVLLKGTRVTIALDGATTSSTVELSGLPKLRPATYGKGSVDEARAGAVIEAFGGRFVGFPPLPAHVHSKSFVNERVDHHGARLEGGSVATIRVERGTHVETLEIRDGDRAVVYNYEKRFPTLDELDHVGECEAGMSQDDDFIWLYSLLDGWDKQMNDHPAPMVRCDPDPNESSDKAKFTHITIFTCFPAVWETT